MNAFVDESNKESRNRPQPFVTFYSTFHNIQYTTDLQQHYGERNYLGYLPSAFQA